MKPEQRPRQENIDLQLGRAGWSVGSRHLIQEYLVASPSLKDAETPFKTKNEFAAFWGNLSCARIMRLQETFAPLMRFRNRRPPSTFVRLSLPDQIQQRHWIVFGPSGEGAFAETYRGASP